MKSKDNELTITLPLSEYVRFHLGDGYWHNRTISQTLAEIIFAKTKNLHTCYIQFVDEYDSHLESPVLWDYGAWQDAHEHFMRNKRWAASERSKRNVFDANVKLALKYVKSYLLLEGDIANITAYSLVKNNKIGALRAMGCKKIYEREEEIP